MSLKPKHKNFKDEYKIKELVKKINIRRNMSILVAFEWHYFQEILNWWHSTFKLHSHIFQHFTPYYLQLVSQLCQSNSSPIFIVRHSGNICLYCGEI